MPLIDPELSLDLPAIFGVSPFPFLLPIHGRVDHWISHADGFTYAALNDRRLIKFRDYRSGGRALASEIPGGAVLWMDCVDGVLHAVKAGSGQRPPRLLSQSLQDGPLRTTELAASGPELQAIHRYGDVIVAIRSHDIRAYSLVGGHSVGQALNPYRWVHGRYLLGKNNYYFVVWDGERVKLEPVALPASMSRSDIALIFDCEGMDGPWLVLNTGTVICSATGEVIALGRSHNLGMNFRQVRVSRDGHRLFIPASHTNSGYLYNLKEKKFFDLSEIPRPELDASPRLPNWNLYRVFQSIAVSEEGIALCGRKGQWRKFVFFANKGIRISSAQTHNESVPFKEPVKTKSSGPL